MGLGGHELEQVLAEVQDKKETIPGVWEQHGMVIEPVAMTVDKMEAKAMRLNQIPSETVANHIKEWISHSFEIFHFLILALLVIIVYSKDVGKLMEDLVNKR